MPKAVQIPRPSIDAIFQALDVLEKIDRRELHTREIKHTPATSPRFPGGISCLGIHTRPGDNQHVATTHFIRMPDGTMPHRHGKDILLGSVKFAVEAE